MKALIDDNPFELINQSDILTADDICTLVPLKDELKETFQKSQVFRTRTEMEVSVLNEMKFPTPAAKYWQAVREQNVMFTELVELSYEYRKKVIEAKKLVIKLENEKDDLEKELVQIDIERTQFHLKQMEKVAKDRIREIRAWSEIKAREALNMTTEELADVDNHQLISYTIRHIKHVLSVGKSGSPAEVRNLHGQLISCLNVCKAKGIVESVINNRNFSYKELAAISGISVNKLTEK